MYQKLRAATVEFLLATLTRRPPAGSRLLSKGHRRLDKALASSGQLIMPNISSTRPSFRFYTFVDKTSQEPMHRHYSSIAREKLDIVNVGRIDSAVASPGISSQIYSGCPNTRSPVDPQMDKSEQRFHQDPIIH
jgi:hypothetical protein